MLNSCRRGLQYVFVCLGIHRHLSLRQGTCDWRVRSVRSADPPHGLFEAHEHNQVCQSFKRVPVKT